MQRCKVLVIVSVTFKAQGRVEV